MMSSKASKKQHQGKTVAFLAKVAAAALVLSLADFSSFTVNAWSLKGMLGMDGEAQPSSEDSSFLGNAEPESKRQLSTTGTAATTGPATFKDQFSCVDDNLFQMVRWLPSSSQEWF